MIRHRLALLAAALGVLLLLPCLALGKGPTEASIDGPGLEEPLRVGDRERPDLRPGAPMMELAEAAGFFAAVFRQERGPVLDERPTAALGPRYVITYLVPGPNGREDLIRQDVYPYAEPRPVTYLAPGQPVFGTRTTRGGWFLAGPALEQHLVAAGLPQSPPGGTGGPLLRPAVGLVAALLGLSLGAVALIVALRRRTQLHATRRAPV